MRLLVRSMVVLTLMAAVANSQDLEPKAMTIEEIEAQLKNAPSLGGQIILDDKPLCEIDSDEGNKSWAWRSLNAGEERPKSWADTGSQPKIVIKLSKGQSADGLVLTSSGRTVNPQWYWIERLSASEVPTFSLKFGGPAQPGNYEFAFLKGSLVLFSRCGFTVKTQT